MFFQCFFENHQKFFHHDPPSATRTPLSSEQISILRKISYHIFWQPHRSAITTKFSNVFFWCNSMLWWKMRLTWSFLIAMIWLRLGGNWRLSRECVRILVPLRDVWMFSEIGGQKYVVVVMDGSPYRFMINDMLGC